jgi:divalent metal cation (Fe/Co/Zn/Cd) transporter
MCLYDGNAESQKYSCDKIKETKSKEQVLLLSMVTGISACFISFGGFYYGKTTVQLIDMMKRTIEVSSVIVAYFSSIRYKNEKNKLKKAELFSSEVVSLIMFISAVLLGIVTFLKLQQKQTYGNVLIGICISCGDITMNSFFLMRYHKLSTKLKSKLIASQKYFYAMKVLSNLTVLISLVLIFTVKTHMTDKLIDTTASCILILISISMAVRNLLNIKNM